MTSAIQSERNCFRSVYYVGSGAKFLACTFSPAFGVILLSYVLRDPREVKDILVFWRVNLFGGLVAVAGLGLILWLIALMFWFPLRCFVFPKLTEGIFCGTSIHEARKGRSLILNIAIGDQKPRAHNIPKLIRVLETIPQGAQVRVTSGPNNSIVRVEVAS